MKKNRNAAALVLALVLAFSMSVSAFAAGNGTATIDVLGYGESLMGESMTVEEGMTAADALREYSDLYGLGLQWKTVENLNPNFGPTAQVIKMLFDIESSPIGADSGIPAQFWSSTYPGYGIESTEIVDGKTLYHYIYVGDDWIFTVNGEKPMDSSGNGYELYMDQYTVEAGDQITVDYTTQVVRWDSYDYWLTA